MTNPSAIILATIYTFFNKVFTGWKKLEDATIHGDGFTVNFYRLTERTIDHNCDALNGWRTVWTKYLVELITPYGKKTVTLNDGKTADKFFNILKNVTAFEWEGEGTVSASENAEITFDSLKNFIH